MAEIKRKWDLLTKEKRRIVLQKVIAYFKEEREIEIGMIAAEEILDFFLQILSDDIYNKGIEDSKTVIQDCFEGLKIDLDVLQSK